MVRSSTCRTTSACSAWSMCILITRDGPGRVLPAPVGRRWADGAIRSCLWSSRQRWSVSEWGERIIFLRTLRDGGASKSYGIQCARLAGMPPHVVERARALLAELERRPRYGPPTQQLSLFGQSPAQGPPPAVDHPVVDAVRALDPDTLSPRAALEALYRLTELLEPRNTNEGS